MTSSRNSLHSWGLSPFFVNQDLNQLKTLNQSHQPIAKAETEDLVLARIISHERSLFTLITESGKIRGVVPGKSHFHSHDGLGRPAVGDWVYAEDHGDKLRICHVLERRTAMVRHAAGGEGAAQVIAANVDTAFIVMACGRDFNIRRLERYISLVLEADANPVIVINKVDLIDNTAIVFELLGKLGREYPVECVSAETGANLAALEPYFLPNKTVAVIGSSGVGKSTLTNALLKSNKQQIGAIRGKDERGRHTTTRRDLLKRKSGGLIIDTPGMRELSLWLSEDQDQSIRGFQDIYELAEHCKFKDCRHQSEPGCAVNEAIDHGLLQAERMANYRKIERERAWLLRKTDKEARRREHRRWRQISKAQRSMAKIKNKLHF